MGYEKEILPLIRAGKNIISNFTMNGTDFIISCVPIRLKLNGLDFFDLANQDKDH